MKAITKILALGAALAVSTSLAYADTLGVGAINFDDQSGAIDLTLPSTSSPGQLTFLGSQQVTGISTGSLSSFANGEIASFDNITSFSPLDLSSANPGGAFITVNNGTDTLEYYLSSIVQTTNCLPGYTCLDGTGYFTVTQDGTGDLIDSSTPGTFDLSTSGNDTAFEASSAIAPEPGSLLLLGTGLLCAAEVARRKFAAKVAL